MSAGSDCVTGKTQFATKKVAAEVAKALRRRGGGVARPMRCGWCGCWHVGNGRADNSKSRVARRR